MKFCQFVLKINSGISQGPEQGSSTNVGKIMCNNPNVDLINMNAYLKFGEILSICSQDIEQKRNNDGMTDNPNPSPPLFFKARL